MHVYGSYLCVLNRMWQDESNQIGIILMLMAHLAVFDDFPNTVLLIFLIFFFAEEAVSAEGTFGAGITDFIDLGSKVRFGFRVRLEQLMESAISIPLAMILLGLLITSLARKKMKAFYFDRNDNALCCAQSKR